MKPTTRSPVTPLAALLLCVAVLAGCTPAGDAWGKGAGAGLADPVKKDIAMRLVASAENSTLDWKAQYKYIEDIGDGRGYTGGIIGFCSGTGDMLRVVERYARSRPGNALERFLPALRKVKGSDAHTGLGNPFTRAWAAAAGDARFRAAQDAERDDSYFDPAVRRARKDGLGTLGQFVYYDAYVMHGEADADGTTGFRTISSRALADARPPAQGGDERAYLDAFLDSRVAAIREEPSHSDTSRVETAQRVFLRRGNLELDPPLDWKVYGDRYHID
ncbi:MULTISPECIES: chitosanase [unclassified Streptomyces]|uniref:chitosanase n=1 Tax=unclassified Streptomyces TaxID=2593676 RepID=UPI000DACB3C3|nr:MULTISPECIES: chitosanase [unclassified Streptomyces]PZT77489.1 chitosanase [Streptomyces sp. AC1-42W]PZT78556.1 chitosanase [Streptomyces sp. AC1-42T]